MVLRKVPSVYIAATKQHVGKTSVSLGLVSGLQKRFKLRNKNLVKRAKTGQYNYGVGFIKPVGQQSVPILNSKGMPCIVDKDVPLFVEHLSV